MNECWNTLTGERYEIEDESAWRYVINRRGQDLPRLVLKGAGFFMPVTDEDDGC